MHVHKLNSCKTNNEPKIQEKVQHEEQN